MGGAGVDVTDGGGAVYEGVGVARVRLGVALQAAVGDGVRDTLRVGVALRTP
jgi:hypothetical protein